MDFSGPKVLSFWLKSVPYHGNELTDEVENCKKYWLKLKKPLKFPVILF